MLSASADHHFRTAIRLKRAIDKVPIALTPIGTIVNTFGRLADWKAENSDEDNEEEEEEEEEAEEEEEEEEEEKGEKGEESHVANDDASAAADAGEKRPRSLNDESVQSKRYKPMTESVCKRLFRICKDATRSFVTTETCGGICSYGFSSTQYKLRIAFPIKSDAVAATSAHPPGGAPVTEREAVAAAAAAAAEEPVAAASEPHAAAAGAAASTSDIKGVESSSLTYDGCVAGVPLDLIEKLWKHAPASGFGDVKNLTTKIDLSVRNARELTADQFDVDPSVCDELARAWSTCMFPRRVKVVPYKINVYGPGGKFNNHLDTPQLGLVGTALVGLHDSTDIGAGLSLNHGAFNWRANRGDLLLMYPDVPHEVLEVTSGYRATIAFKIMADVSVMTHDERRVIENQFTKKRDHLQRSFYRKLAAVESKRIYSFGGANVNDREIDAQLDDLRKENDAALEALKQEQAAACVAPISDEQRTKRDKEVLPLGFEAIRAAAIKSLRTELASLELPFALLLNHKYSVNSADTLLGADALIMRVLSEMPEFRTIIFPVLTKFHEQDGADDGRPEQ